MHRALEHLCQYSLDEMSMGNAVVPLLSEFAATLQAEFPDSVVDITVVDQSGQTFQYVIFPRIPFDFTSRLVNNPITGNTRLHTSPIKFSTIQPSSFPNPAKQHSAVRHLQ